MLKEFIMRGNVLDMAVGIIIGAAFGKMVSSLVSDILMPPLGFLLGKVDFSSLFLVLHEKTADSAKVAIHYGLFINSMIDFIIIGFAIFMVVKQVNRFNKAPESPVAPATKECQYCSSAIAVKATRCPVCTSQL